MSQNIDIFTRHYTPTCLKCSFVVGSLLVRSVIEEIAKRERSYKASTFIKTLNFLCRAVYSHMANFSFLVIFVFSIIQIFYA